MGFKKLSKKVYKHLYIRVKKLKTTIFEVNYE